MTRAGMLDRLLRGVGEDVRDYRVLMGLLETQFELALRHEAAPMESLSARISALVDVLDARRRERVSLVEHLQGPGRRMADVFGLLPPQRRRLLETGWQTLEKLVRDCKALNARNCRLLMDQQAILQRVLHGDDEIYAPA